MHAPHLVELGVMPFGHHMFKAAVHTWRVTGLNCDPSIVATNVLQPAKVLLQPASIQVLQSRREQLRKLWGLLTSLLW